MSYVPSREGGPPQEPALAVRAEQTSPMSVGQSCGAPRIGRALRFAVVGLLFVAGCSGLPSLAEQRRMVADGDLRLQQVSDQAVLDGWGAPSYSSVQRVQFFPLSSGNWMPSFRIKLGEVPQDWDLTTVLGDGLFLAYAERGEMLGFYEARLVYRERLPPEHIHALGKQWERESLFRTRLENPGGIR